MIRLRQIFGAHAGRVVELDRDVIRFGRLPDNEVAFDPHADLDASGRHAEIRREGGEWILHDSNSRNGTLVRGKRITRHVLTDGDEVEFGLGGPRIKVEIVGGGRRHAAQTAAATPIASSPGSRPPGSTPPNHPPGAPVEPTGPMIPEPSYSPVAQPTPPPSPFAGNASTPAPVSSPPAAVPVSPPAQPVHSAPDPSVQGGPPVGGPKMYGQRTVGVMIQSALQQQAAQQRPGHSTDYVRAVASEAAQRSSRGLKVAIAIISVLVLLTLGAVVALFFYANWQEDQLRDENVELQEELAALGDGDAAERARLEQRIQELNEEIASQQQSVGERIASDHAGAVYVLLAQRNNGRRDVICTAFAVRADLLATNAHCVNDLERAMGQGRSVQILPNRGQGQPLSVQQMWRHPHFQSRAATPSPDIGLIRPSAQLSQLVDLATPEQLHDLRVGGDVFVVGFPGQLAPNATPVAGLTAGVVGRMTAFDGSDAPWTGQFLISHSAFSDQGTAGSPIFDREGRVVAVNAGNYRGHTRVTDRGVGMSRTVTTETPYAWSVRADVLRDLIAGLGH